MVWVLSFKQKVLVCIDNVFFWGGKINVRCTTGLYSWTAPSCIICKWSSPMVIRRRLLFTCRWHLYFYQHEGVKKIENVLNKEFSSLCQWLIYYKLSIHFGKDKTKFILFSKTRGLGEINITFTGHSIKQHETVEYFGCQLDSKLSGEAMASKVLKQVNAKLKFLYHQSRYLTPAYLRPLCNALIQPHFHYRYSSWFPLLKKNLKMYSLLSKFTSEISYRSIAP